VVRWNGEILVKSLAILAKDAARNQGESGLTNPLKKQMAKPSLGPVLFSQKQIASRVYTLGCQITDDYRKMTFGAGQVTLVGVMKGSIMFLADLAREIELDVQIELVRAESYHGFASTGTVAFSGLAHLNLTGRHVLVVEDIIDSGLTVQQLLPHLQHTQPASLAVCTLLGGYRTSLGALQPDYVGFQLTEKAFVVGYGLDYNNQYRNLPDIRILKDAEE